MKKNRSVPRIMISAAGSHCGKTTVTDAVISAFCMKGLKVQCYKSGPDYIDPMFHTKITGRETFHTDAFFLEKNQLNTLVAKTSAGADICVIEGAMGFYDGIGQSSEGSAYTVSEMLETPAILVINPEGMGCSAGALCKGFRDFRLPNRIRGFILNCTKEKMYDYYKSIIERETGLKVYGYLPYIHEAELESRHLGLVTANEVSDFEKRTAILGQTALKTLDIKGLSELANSAAPICYQPYHHAENNKKFRLGVAMDSAFCFYYAENLRMLEDYGAEIVKFSPLSDNSLPESLNGIYIGGGYPELYLEKLSKNTEFKENLKKMSDNGIPIFAECGGFMYLQEAIFGRDGKEYPMAGILKGKSKIGEHLCRFGYITLIAEEDTLIAKKGTEIKAHEFHYSDSTDNGESFTAYKPNGKKYKAIQNTKTITGGFPHIYFPSAPETVKSFAEKCLKYQGSQNII